jgi:uncharacterized SAM-dependent methyltransferase
VIGLGCGGGQKDTRLLELLKLRGKQALYTPCDVSLTMVLTARQTALTVVPEQNCLPFVCDLATADDLPVFFESRITSHESRIITFFGMIPNFEPEQILPKLAALVRPKDILLFSANLAPGEDYAVGMRKVLPQYDNPLTRDWLMTFLDDLGIARRDGRLRIGIAPGRGGLKRVIADFHFRRSCRVAVVNETFNFRGGETLRLFFSYRYTPDRVRAALGRHGLKVCEQWITKSGEEGVFLCNRASEKRR